MVKARVKECAITVSQRSVNPTLYQFTMDCVVRADCALGKSANVLPYR